MQVNTTKSYPTINQGFGIVGILVLVMVLFSPIVLLAPQIGKSLSGLLSYLLAMGISLWLVFNIRRKKTGIESFNFKPFDLIIAPLVVIGSIGIAVGVSIPIVSLIPVPQFVKELFLSMYDDGKIYSFITMVIAAPILEELIFRGIILDGFLKIYSPVKSIVLSSTLFGLAHLNPWQFLSGLFVGLFMGWIYYRTQSLWLTILSHLSLNLFSFASTLITNTTLADMDKTAVELYGGLSNFIIIVGSSWIAIIVSVYYLNRHFSHEKAAIEYVENNSAA
jgi:membrane protease YdiL (CAAX protease family)